MRQHGWGFEIQDLPRTKYLLALQARPLLNRAIEDGNFDALADPRLQNEYSHNEMARMIACAAACVRHSARRRPRMSQVIMSLKVRLSI